MDTSNGYSDVLRKIGINPKGGNPKTLQRIINEYNLDTNQLNKNRSELFKECANKINNKKKLEDIFSGKELYNDGHKLLKRLIEEGYKKEQCEICGIANWQNKKIIFQLHHIDGNRMNNQLSNLQILCPNCHSQTENYRGKKKNDKKISKIEQTLPPISRNELKELIRNKPFLTIGKIFNVTDNAIRKWCDKYNLPRRVSDIKQISDQEWSFI